MKTEIKILLVTTAIFTTLVLLVAGTIYAIEYHEEIARQVIKWFLLILFGGAFSAIIFSFVYMLVNEHYNPKKYGPY